MFRIDGADATPAEVEQTVAAVAERLRNEGLGPGKRLLYHGPQSAAAMVLFHACWRLGAAFAPIDETWPEFQVARAARVLAPRWAVTTHAGSAMMSAAAPTSRLLALSDLERSDALGELNDWAGGASAPLEPLDDELIAACLFTSGSSGAPKAVELSRRALLHGGRLTLETFGWQAGERLVNLPDPHTMSGLRNAFLAAPMGGLAWSPLPPSSRPDLFSLLDALTKSRCERLVCGPLFIRQVVMLGDRTPAGLFADLKAVYCTGASLDPDAVQQFFDRFGAPVINYYGLTETGGICLSQRLGSWNAGDRSLGWPAGCEARLAADGRELEGPAEGELEIRSPQLMSGYAGQAEATAERLNGPWLRTGDIARRRQDGAYELVGRANLYIKTLATERVHPEEVEEALEGHPLVAEAAVFGRAEASGGERIVALVTLKSSSGLDVAAELADHVRQRLGPARAPSLVRVVERLPRHGNGKLIRTALPELL